MNLNNYFSGDAMYRFIKLIPILLFAVSYCAPGALCQTSFKLVKKNGHYYSDASVNGNDNTPIFVETGFHGMVVSEEWYNKILASLPLEEITLDREEHLHIDRTKRKISKLLKGKVPVDDLTFEGRVFVVDSHEDYVTLPVNLLKNETDTMASLIRFDFKKNVLDFVRYEDVNLDKMRTYALVKNAPCLFLRRQWNYLMRQATN